MTLDICLRRKRYTQSVYAFLKRLVKQFEEPRVIVTDKAPSIRHVFARIQGLEKYKEIEHRRIKFLNNLIEQDQRKIKIRSKSYNKRQRNDTCSIQKIRREGNLFVFSTLNEVTNLLAT